MALLGCGGSRHWRTRVDGWNGQPWRIWTLLLGHISMAGSLYSWMMLRYYSDMKIFQLVFAHVMFSSVDLIFVVLWTVPVRIARVLWGLQEAAASVAFWSNAAIQALFTGHHQMQGIAMLFGSTLSLSQYLIIQVVPLMRKFSDVLFGKEFTISIVVIMI